MRAWVSAPGGGCDHGGGWEDRWHFLTIQAIRAWVEGRSSEHKALRLGTAKQWEHRWTVQILEKDSCSPVKRLGVEGWGWGCCPLVLYPFHLTSSPEPSPALEKPLWGQQLAGLGCPLVEGSGVGS